MNAPSLERFFYGKPWHALKTYLRQTLCINSLWRSRRNVMAHYDLGNDFYALWLDKGMTYSCALFENDVNRSLENAQDAKYQRILRKLDARAGQHILEIGAGWGGFAEAAARQGLFVTAVTLSKEQEQYANERLRRAGLQELATVQLADYRHISGRFDHVVSIGMFEHVGERYWRSYFSTIKKCLKPGGNAMIQSITIDDDIFEKRHRYSGFMEQVIFPGGMLPSKSRFLSSARQAGLEGQEMFTFGKDYILTAQHWLNRFHAHKDEARALGYDERFLRLWRFYLSACIAAFASGRTDVMQVRLTHKA
jgi:cyclopropane-fatty-acyl-phospholipid synthase